MMLNKCIFLFCFFCFFAFACHNLYAQVPTSNKKVYGLDVINDLLDTQQQDATKPAKLQTVNSGASIEESLFSIEVLTASDLQGFGFVTVPEALRLVPGLLVQQSSTGMYDVQFQAGRRIYGGNNPSPVENAPILLMIDFEVVNLAYNNRIPWENIPVGINEIAQIEVYKTSLPVFFGTQAVSGVIHIIRNTEGKRNVSIRLGNHRNLHADVNVPITNSDNFSATLGGHFNYTDKSNNDVYIYNEGRFITADSSLLYQPNATLTNVFSEQSMRSYGGNVKLLFNPKEDVNFRFNANFNYSEGNSPWLYIDQIAESRRSINTYSGVFTGHVKNFDFRLNYRLGNLNLAEGYSGFAFNTQHFNSRLAYKLKVSEKFTVTPFASAQTDQYKVRDISDSEEDSRYGLGIADSESRLLTAAGVNFIADLSDKFQLYGGFRAESISLAESTALIGQLATRVQISESGILRISASQTQAPSNLEAWIVSRAYSDQVGTDKIFTPNSDLDLPTFLKLDLSYQSSVSEVLTVKGEVFYSILDKPIVQESIISGTTEDITFLNNNGDVTSMGATISAETTLNNLKLRAHITVQNSDLSGTNVSAALGYSPSFFGGLGVISRFMSDKLLVSGTAYFGGTQNMATPFWNQDTGVNPILQARVSYKIWQENVIFIEARELQVSEISQMPFGNVIKPRFMLGGMINF